MTPTFADDWLTVYQGDALVVLRTLPTASVDCVVTSPPYWGHRDYECEGQLGLEMRPEQYVDALVDVFREVRRVVTPRGTVWLNLGDAYADRANKRSDGASFRRDRADVVPAKRRSTGGRYGLKAKDMIGLPWRVAFALQADGWYLRSDIIWAKPNPMPASYKDRPTTSHEYVFLLTRSPRYHFDALAIAEEVTDSSRARWRQDVAHQVGSDRVPGKSNGNMKAVGGRVRPQAVRAVELARNAGLTDEHLQAVRAVGITDVGKAQVTQHGSGHASARQQELADEAKAVLGGYYREFLIAEVRNPRDVWTVPTVKYAGAHFATFPPKLVEPCILAGCPEGGTVLDPFAGTGTVGLVAANLSRRAVLIDLNADYLLQALHRNRNVPLGLVEAAS